MTRPLALTALVALVALTAMLGGCRDESDEPLTRDEADEALAEARLSTGAEALTYEMVTLTTDFTLGDAVEAAAENLRAFAESQLPCADVSLAGKTITIDFGVTDACVYKGRAYTGQAAVRVERVGRTAIVEHTWTALSDGMLTVDGEATVTWDPATRSRHVEHDLTWTDGEQTGAGRGDRTQTLLDGFDGIAVDGERRWTGFAGGEWVLDIEAVEMRLIDPLPQAGTYTLTTPIGKTLSMTFTRKRTNSIEVRIESGRRKFVYEVGTFPAELE